MNNEITIILISHKSKDLVLEYIETIYQKFKILIIDNSNDLILKNVINKNYPNITMKIIDNNGYGQAINYGSQFVKTKYFLISNPDISGVNQVNILKFLYIAKKLNNRFSVMGPKYINMNQGHLEFKKKFLKKNYVQEEIEEKQFLSGACMFFNKKNFDLLNGFDENFFLYFEENDYCLRSYKKNKNYQVNSIIIKHNVGNSVITNNNHDKLKYANLRTWHFIWSKFYYFKKHYGFILAFFYFIPIIIRIRFRIILYAIKKDHKNIYKYKSRWSGLFYSLIGRKSFKRI
tara:strand:+ start:294 stop:1160 length:867 start_codon:yes stop_codon:yes gene_type:complete